MHDSNGKPLKIGDQVIYGAKSGLYEVVDDVDCYIPSCGIKRPGELNSFLVHPDNLTKVRSWKELAQEALDVQNACNLSGVIHSFSRIITEIRARLDHEGKGKGGTDNINRHPISVVFADKINSLVGIPQDCSGNILPSYKWVHDTAEGKTE